MISKRRHSETHSHETNWKIDLLKELTEPEADEHTLSYSVFNLSA